MYLAMVIRGTENALMLIVEAGHMYNNEMGDDPVSS